MRWLALVGMVLTPTVGHAQRWQPILTGAALTSLWIDYAQIRYGIDHGSPTWVLGHQLTPTSLVAVNALEAVGNLSAPKKYRPWINAATLGFHVIAIYKTAHRPIGLLLTRRGEEVAHIGFRLWW